MSQNNATPLITPTAAPPIPRKNTPAALLAAAVAAAAAGTVAAKAAWSLNPEISGQLGSAGFHALAGFKAAGDLIDAGYDGWARGYGEALAAAGWAAWWRVSAMWAAALAAGIGAFAMLNVEIDPVRHHRGRRMLKSKDLARLTRTVKSPAAVLDGIKIDSSQIAKGITAIGSSGGGKTQLVHQLWPQLKAAGWRGILVDGAKGDYSSADLYGDCEVIAPWHQGLAWDIAKDCQTRAAAIELASRIIPANEKDPMWSNAARAIFVVIACWLIATRGTNWTWGDLWDGISQPLERTKELAALYYTPALAVLADVESKTTLSVLINLLAFCAGIYEMAQAWRNVPPERRVSILGWLLDESDRRSFILQNNGQFAATARAYIQGIIGMCAAAVISPEMPESKTRKTIFVVDEAAQLGRIESIEKFLEVGRSKTCTVFLATQSPAQLREYYGDNNLATIYSCVGIRFWLRTTGDADQQYVAAQIGKREVWVPQQNVNASAGGFAVGNSYGKDEIWITYPSELGLLGPGKKGIVGIYDDGGDGLAKVHYQYTTVNDKFRPAFVRNPDFNVLPISSAIEAAASKEHEPAPSIMTAFPTSQTEWISESGADVYTIPAEEEQAEENTENDAEAKAGEASIEGLVHETQGEIAGEAAGLALHLMSELGGQEVGEVEQVVQPVTQQKKRFVSRRSRTQEQE